MSIRIGDRLPDVTMTVMSDDGPVDVTTDELFAGRRVALFALPGAFTPTCHRNHLPGYLDNHDTIRARGVDAIVCLSVNDAFVMHAWGDKTGANGKIVMLADGNADFTRAVGMESDARAGGMGLRSKRYSMIVEDGVVRTLNVDEVRGQTTFSGAAALIRQL